MKRPWWKKLFAPAPLTEETKDHGSDAKAQADYEKLLSEKTEKGKGELPTRVAINHDDYHAEHVGRTADGLQFFLTSPFEPAAGENPGNEFIALFLFDGEGKFLEAKIDEFGPRAQFDEEKRSKVYAQRLQELGSVSFERIEVSPFSVDRFGTSFGLIPRAPEEEGNSWAVELLPGNYMAFFEPWDSGDYDT